MGRTINALGADVLADGGKVYLRPFIRFTLTMSLSPIFTYLISDAISAAVSNAPTLA